MEKLIQNLYRVGRQIELQRIELRTQITCPQELESAVEESAGLYWIETNMPTDELLKAIRKVSGKNKNIRVTKPEGVGFTKPIDGFRVVYSGTGHALRTRLFEHLFNKGNKLTAKLSAIVNQQPFSRYEWYVSAVYVRDYPSRYALESWWRLNVGWPPFCIR